MESTRPINRTYPRFLYESSLDTIESLLIYVYSTIELVLCLIGYVIFLSSQDLLDLTISIARKDSQWIVYGANLHMHLKVI